MYTMIDVDHNKKIDILKLGCLLPNMVNMRFYISLDSIFYPFAEMDENLFEQIRKTSVGGPSIVFTGKSVVDEIFYGSQRICASVSLQSMPVSFIPTQGVNLLICIGNGSVTLRSSASHLAKANRAP